jgi:hypothetical protein
MADLDLRMFFFADAIFGTIDLQFLLILTRYHVLRGQLSL